MRQNYSFSKNGNALLEPCEGKLSCTVLRGESPSNGADLLDIKEIAYIAIPLSSKIFIHFYSEKLFDDSIPDSIIKKAKSKEVFDLNLKTLNFSYTTVGCESKLYLRLFIDKVHNQ